MRASRIPLNLFGIPFGLAGLAACWLTLAQQGQAPSQIADALIALAAAVWLVLAVRYLAYLLNVRAALKNDLLDPVAAPFASLIVIVPMLLSTQGVVPHLPALGRVLVDVFLVLVVLLGGWFTGQWIYGTLDLDRFHPGYFLPTVAGGLIGCQCAATIGQRLLAETMFGLGLVCWLLLGSIILGRLLLRPLFPPPLIPTLAIEVAPAAVASLSYFALNGDRIDTFAAAVGGYGVLMVLAQLRLLPVYRRLPFMPSTWAFTFSWAAVATVALHWLHDLRPTGYRTYEYLVVAAISLLIGAIALRTLLALARGELLPGAPSGSAPASVGTVAGPEARIGKEDSHVNA